ncbi:MAG: phosphate ABC transporter permease PstA [Planctomycetota bacterium]|nr:MAG: phosphate ABC transporter permease PstA [Planctomycetota bacterium]
MSRVTLSAYGEPMLWLTGGALALCVVMVVGLLGFVFYQGLITFWPKPLVQVQTRDGQTFLGEIARVERFRPGPDALDALPEETRRAAEAVLAENDGWAVRELLRTGNFELTNVHFRWFAEYELLSEKRTYPQWSVTFERLAWGRFYGTPVRFEVDGEAVAQTPAEAWNAFAEVLPQVADRREKIHAMEKRDIGDLNRLMDEARLAVRRVELKHGKDSPQYAAAQKEYEAVVAELQDKLETIQTHIDELKAENARYALYVQTADGREVALAPADIVRAYPANRLGFADKWAIYGSRFYEFLTAEPREANSEGGVFPAIFGTVVMTLLMTLAVVPLGVLAALYLREYAKSGAIVSVIRIAINNLAGVPSIVFGVFGLGFFCYMVGGTIDQLFFPERLPSPTFGTGGILWASLTLALLTLPVVIVATEEALAAVPNSIREGSYACGAGKWQTIRRVVLPQAVPGVLTGTILAMARGAGEVAPLMIVGVVKLAPLLPVDHVFPYIHLERSFMHLGFHIYDLGFQSQNSEAAKPMVFTTTLLLILIVAVLNLAAIWVRKRLRQRHQAAAF